MTVALGRIRLGQTAFGTLPRACCVAGVCSSLEPPPLRSRLPRMREICASSIAKHLAAWNTSASLSRFSVHDGRLARWIEMQMVLKRCSLASQSIPVIKVQGAPYRRGLEHGRKCGDLIRRYPEILLQVMRLEAGWRALDANAYLPDREGLLARAMNFLPSLDAFAPHLVEEVRGIADFPICWLYAGGN